MTNTKLTLIQPYIDLRNRTEAWLKVNPKSFMGPYRPHMYTLEGWFGVLDVCGNLQYPASDYASSWWCEGGDPLLDIELLTRVSNPPIEQVRLLGSFAEPIRREMQARNLTDNHVAYTAYLHLRDCEIQAAKDEWLVTNSIEYGPDWSRFNTDSL